MGRPAEAADPMVPESDQQSGHQVNPDTTDSTIEISPATYNSQHGQKVHQEGHQLHPTKMPGIGPHPSSQPKDNPINHHQHHQQHHKRFQFPLHQQPSPSPSNQASYQPRDAPPQAPPEKFPPQTQPPQATANYPPESETPQVANYPPKAPPASYPLESETPLAANYPPQTGPADYPPQSKPKVYQNSYQNTQRQQEQQPVQFPPPQAYSYAAVDPQHPQATFLFHNEPGLQHNVSAAPGIPTPQPYPQPPVGLHGINAGTEAWTTNLFGFMEDPQNALLTFFFPCITFGQIAEIIDNGHTSCGTSGMFYGAIGFLIGMPCLLSFTYRTKLRSKYDLVEAPAPDWLTHCLCECCALSQEYRELRKRGFDPALGWIGNLSRIQKLQQQQQIAMVPPMNQTMM